MKIIKQFLLSITIGIGIISSPAQAGAFNSQISNPFVFCKLPKPCKLCQPFRKIHEELCAAGRPTAEAQKMHNDAVSQGYGNINTPTAEELQSKFTPAVSSAYDETPKDVEIERYIGWLAKQQGPTINNTVFPTMMDYWKAKGITNPYKDATIINTATQVIKDRNQQIVAAVSLGSVPLNPKPWFPETQTQQQPQPSTPTAIAPINNKVSVSQQYK
jgi:hypothetical protein